MTIDNARTLAEGFYQAKPFYRDPAYTLWIQAVSTFVRFAEEANSQLDPEALEALCYDGTQKG